MLFCHKWHHGRRQLTLNNLRIWVNPVFYAPQGRINAYRHNGPICVKREGGHERGARLNGYPLIIRAYFSSSIS